jgi:general secretion pathway protein E/type IV pilus assembly protein PilB
MTELTDNQKKDVADLLFEAGKINANELEQIRRHQLRVNQPQHRLLVELNIATEEDTYRALAKLNNLPYVDLSELDIPQVVLNSVPMKLIFHYRMVPISLEGDTLTIALSEHLKQLELGNLRLVLNKRLKVSIASPSAIHSFLKNKFGLGAATIERLRQDKGGTTSSDEIILDIKQADNTQTVDPTIADFVDPIILEALRLQATDIHIEPYGSSIRLRYRIDGLMQHIPLPS